MTATPALTPQRLAWLTLRSVRGEAITYTRGDLVINLVAVPTQADARQVDAGESLVVTSRDLDWLVDPAELIDENSAQVEPRAGDKITRADNTTYRVQPTGSSDDAWRWSDPLQTWRRIQSAKQ